MLEHLPQWLGATLRTVRAGHAKLAIVQPGLEAERAAALRLASPAFADGGRLPDRFTADGAGVSPPLTWGELPEGTRSLALIVEDPDAPAPQPLVHAIVWDLPPDAAGLDEGAIVADGAGGPDGRDVGRSSFLREGWLPPDPPTGHGVHDYVFQLFALGPTEPLAETPRRGDVVDAMAGRVLGTGLLVGTYSRGEEAPVGPAGATEPGLGGIGPALA